MLRSSQARFAGVALAVTAALALFVSGSEGTAAFILLWTCIHALLAMSLRLGLLVGEVNLAMGAFYGLGAYSAAKLSIDGGVPFLLAVLCGAVVAAVAGALFGASALRASGAAFILVSFAFNEVLRLVYSRSQSLGGNSGIVGIYAEPRLVAVTIVVVTGCIAVGLFLLESSRWGYFFKAVENKPLLAASVGLEPKRVKLLAIVVSAAVAGAAGGLFAHFSTVIAPQDFSFLISISVLAYVMIGGRDYLSGAILGAAVLTYVSEELRIFGEYEPLVYGVALMASMVFFPRGLAGGIVAALTRLRGVRSTVDRGSTPPGPEPSLEGVTSHAH